MQQSNSYHLKTPRKSRQTNIIAQELLQKLTQSKLENKYEKVYFEKYPQIYGAKNVKQTSKSIGVGSQSYRVILQQNLNLIDMNKQSQPKDLSFRQFNEEICRTEKKSSNVCTNSQILTKRNRTDSNHLTPRKIGANDFILNASAFLKEKQLENKLDKLSYQVIKLQNKSNQLEIQNRMLLANIQSHQQDSNKIKDKHFLIQKLDTMISMQQRQEENLNYFKQLFKENIDENLIKQNSLPGTLSSGLSNYHGLKI